MSDNNSGSSTPKEELTGLQIAISCVFAVTIVLSTCVLLFRDTPNATVIGTVIGLLIAALLVLAFGTRLSEFTFGPLKAKVRDLTQQVAEQQRAIAAITTALKHVITPFEYEKLEGLERDGPFLCHFHDNLVGELKRLYDHGFVKETHTGSFHRIKEHRGSDQPFDLKAYLALDTGGEQYLKCLREWGNPPPSAK